MIFRRFSMNDRLPKAKLKDRVMHLVGRRRAFLVEGESMVPTLKNGDIVLVDPQANFSIGDVVLAKHPYKSSVMILKRIADKDNRTLSLAGDNPAESTDSRTFGAVSIESIIGKVVCRLK